MAADLILQPAGHDVALAEKREELAAVRILLAEQEAENAQLRAELHAFEGRYFRQVGVLYAELDEWEARLREQEAALYGSDEARRRAEEARQRAEESRAAAAAEEQAEDAEAEDTEPPADLKKLFREVARRIHPDVARDTAEEQYFTLLMARANAAYRRGDAELLQRLLDDHRELDAAVEGESVGAELLRLSRQIQHVKRDLAALELEREALRGSELAQLHADAERAAAEYRDLLLEMATRVRAEIAAAEAQFQAVHRQVVVHGR